MFTHCKNQPNSILRLLVFSFLILMTFSTTVALARVERTTDGGDRNGDASVEIPCGGSGDPGDGLTGDPGDGLDNTNTESIQFVIISSYSKNWVVIPLNINSSNLQRMFCRTLRN